jgi:protein SCO1
MRIAYFYFTAILVLGFLLFSCKGGSQRELPFLGPSVVNAVGDSVHHSIPSFGFLNQDGDSVTQATVANKVYVSDFFFTSCPTICPVMKTQMLRVFEKFKGDSSFVILSHTIDPRHDSLQVLRDYRKRLGIEGIQWQFLRAEQDYVHDLAQKSYLVSALEDKTAEDQGGFVHSGAFVLVDKQRHIRGVYDGTKEKEVNRLIKDVELLLR